MRIAQKIHLGFALVILFSILDSLVNFLLTREVHRNMAFLTTSEAILRHSSQLHKGILEMQSGFRGYLVSENEAFLEYYHAEEKRLPSLFREEKTLLKGFPQQIQKLDSINRLQSRWIQYANTIIANKQGSLSAGGGKTFQKERLKKQLRDIGKRLNDAIRVKFEDFERFEYQLRQERSEILQHSIRQTNLASVGLNFIYISIAILAAWFVGTTISRRIGRMVHFAEEISKERFTIMDDPVRDELTRISSSLTIMSQKLSKSFSSLAQKNKELDQFVYAVSHDLKAPLRGMANILTWIEEDLSPQVSESLKRHHDKLWERIGRMENLINGLLHYARIGRMAAILEQVSVEELLLEIRELVVPSHFYFIVQSPMPVLMTEKIHLEQVFTNLISNAVKYQSPQSGTIRVDCTEEESFYRFSVQDEGIGISEEYHQKIFNIFQTLREKHEEESTGIGLAIVKKILEEQGGTVSVKSRPEKGSIFIFTWPKHPVIPTDNEG